MNIRNIFLASLILVSNVNCLNPGVLHEAIFKKKPVHIVTLTRMPADMRGDPRTEDVEYLPISVAEAATVFELTNAFLGGSFTETIDKAHGFDESVFSQIQKIDEQLSIDASVVSIARDALAADATLSQDIREEILRGLQAKQAIRITKQVRLKLLDEEKVVPLTAYAKKNTLYQTLPFLNSLLSPQNRQQLVGKELAADPQPIIFEYKLGDIPLERDAAVKIEDVVRKFNPDSLKDTLKAHLYRHNPILKGYASINPKSVDDYKKLFFRGRTIFEKTPAIDSEIPCLLVVNEQFFGKSFVFPSNFPLAHFIPEFPQNVIACINLLKEETEVLEGLSKTPCIEPRDNFFTSDSITYGEYVDGLVSRKKYFRNVSFYWHMRNVIQEYTKSSYCKEHDSAIQDEFAYIFGPCIDSRGEWHDLISTQICYDMSSGARKGQENPALIHVIQSNRLNIGEYILHDSQRLEERNHIPGQPEIVIHSDPSWPEVFTTDHSFTRIFDLSSEASDVMTKLHYQLLKPKEIFRFFIGNNGYKNAYTITHWVLNGESQ